MNMKYFYFFVILAFLSSCASIIEMHKIIASQSGNDSLPPVFLSNGVFVSMTGNDSNSGLSRLLPVRTIQTGIVIALSNDLEDVYVAEGDYTQGDGLGNGINLNNITNIHLYGGCDIEFKNVNRQYSVLDGKNAIRICWIQNSSNIIMDGFIIKNGLASGAAGGGIYIFRSEMKLFKNVIMSNYQSQGAIFVGQSQMIIENNIICSNYSTSQGGGLNLDGSSVLLKNNEIYHNHSDTKGGGLLIYLSTNIQVINCSFRSNTASSSYDSVHIYYNQNLTNFMIENCYFAGIESTGFVAILEDSLADVARHYLLNNIFNTNRITTIYGDMNTGIISSGSDWTNINITNYTDAAVAQGNSVVCY